MKDIDEDPRHAPAWAQLAQRGLTRAQLQSLQRTLAARICIPEQGGYTPKDGDLVLSLDIQYAQDKAHVAGDIHRLGEGSLGTWAGVVVSTFPYIPRFFCFREGPPLLALVRRMKREGVPVPDVVVIDGHGLAHPRRFGVAGWMGLAISMPTVGAAKGTLVHFEEEPEFDRGTWTPVKLEGEEVGSVLRTQNGVKPMYVSPGDGVSHRAARELLLALPGTYRLAEPLRRADQAARAHARGALEPWMQDFGTLEPESPPWKQ